MKLFSSQENGHCYCKSNVCGDSCDTCEAGYYALENNNYFGCQGKKNISSSKFSHNTEVFRIPQVIFLKRSFALLLVICTSLSLSWMCYVFEISFFAFQKEKE